MNVGAEGQESLGLHNWVGGVPLVSEGQEGKERILQGAMHCVILSA